ncbi:MAG: helix-turn-helix transcriptional regulator [Lachnospiraceae bacterium]|nr:helix-turn-helix transcriptional regulator [Lachnospiraceae bacterium]
MTIGEKIHDLRIRNNMTMEDLAREIGVQRSAINKYEKGLVVNLKRSTIASLCRVFGVPSSYLLDDDNKLTADEHRLVQAYRAADDRAREDALKTLLDHPKKELLSKVK